jgi:hypothetical protein
MAVSLPGSCTCGHAPEEHGHDPKYPGSTACSAEDCECIGYEDSGDAEEDEPAED